MGVDAVIDKDLAAATLAVKINADEFFILTDISNAYLNFNKPDQVKLNKVSAKEMKKYLEEGHFADGSMGPKIKAGLYFIDNGGNDVLITDANNLKILMLAQLNFKRLIFSAFFLQFVQKVFLCLLQ